MQRLNALIVTALQDELEAVLAWGNDGRAGWKEWRDRSGFPYHIREVITSNGGTLRFAAAWSGKMGESAAAVRAQQLIDELDPGCLAMCGICAGRRNAVELGDIVVADRVYSYDDGKHIAGNGDEQQSMFLHDIETYNLEKCWNMDAAFFAREFEKSSALGQQRPPSSSAQDYWILHTLYAHLFSGQPSPIDHPDAYSRCPNWGDRIEKLERQGLIEIDDGEIRLTDRGIKRIKRDQVVYRRGMPTQRPLRVHIGPIATGKAVQQDPSLFTRLERFGRKVLAVEMEAAAIGYVAERLGRRSIIVKSVSDYGDHEKDDGFRDFACRASAEFLLTFLSVKLQTSRVAALLEDTQPVSQPRRDLEYRAPQNDAFISRVEHVSRLREPEGAKIVRVPTVESFAGALEVSVKEGWGIRIFPIGILDVPPDEALIVRFADWVDSTYRRHSAWVLATIVHGGGVAPEEFHRVAHGRGIKLVSFSEYQGLVDLSQYTNWQSNRLELDERYPSNLYVTQRGQCRIGRAKWRQTEDVLKEIETLLVSPSGRLAIVLGDFGTGKTFLMRELTRNASINKHCTPILVEMRMLEKRRRLSELLAQHFAYAGMGRINLDGFRYMLSEGQVLLLFDGFDELAFRVSYERALDYFDTVLQASSGSAKVVVTSRTAHFLTDHDINRELANRAEQIGHAQIIKIHPFDRDQIRQFLIRRLGTEVSADARMALLDDVKDLLGLSANPRMLDFIAGIEEHKLREAKSNRGVITSATLYHMLMDWWLGGEIDRAKAEGTDPDLSVKQLWKAVTDLAILLWPRIDRGVNIAEIPAALIAAAQWIEADRKVEETVARHQIGSRSLLVRDEEGSFSFVHQSVMEWLVARDAADQINMNGNAPALLQREMSDLMVDFFLGLAGTDVARSWAQRTLASPTQDIAVKNALCIQRRIKDATVSDDDISEFTELDIQMDLEGQDLRGQDFAGFDFSGANLQGANLSGATLAGTNLTGACLRDAQLIGAELSGAVLCKADLRDANFDLARMLGADLREALLDGASFRRTKLIGARWDHMGGCDVTGAAIHSSDVVPSWLVASPCYAVVFSPDGTLIASAHGNGIIYLWDAASGSPIRMLRGHRNWITDLNFSPDGRFLASASVDKTVILWSVESGDTVSIFAGHSSIVWSVAFSPDGHTLASSSEDATICLWSVESGDLLRVLSGHSETVMRVAFSQDGSWLASCSSDQTICLWQVGSWRKVATFRGHSNAVSAIAFSPDGRTIASASFDTTIALWDVESGKLRVVRNIHADTVFDLAFSPDGRALASASFDNSVAISDVDTGRVAHVIRDHSNWVLSVSFSPDGRSLVTGSVDHAALLIDVSSGNVKHALGGGAANVKTVVFADSGSVLVGVDAEHVVSFWDVHLGRQMNTVRDMSIKVTCAASVPGGGTIVAGSASGAIFEWHASTCALKREWRVRNSGISNVAVSRYGALLAVASEKSVSLCRMEGELQIYSVLWGHSGDVYAVAFDRRGRLLASCGEDGRVILWDTLSGAKLRVLVAHTNIVNTVASSSREDVFASGGADGRVILWDAASGIALEAFEGHSESVRSVCFSPDGAIVASASLDATVVLWSVKNRKKFRVLSGHESAVTSVSFSADGRFLASGANDGTVRLWDVLSGHCVAVLLALPGGWVAFSPDGRYRMDGSVQGAFWYASKLCRFAPGELDEYIPELRLP